jgi:predicted nuclease of predicted toxin-antitoxin system
MVRFYMDENVPGAITRGLLRRSVDVITAQEDGYDNTPDPEVLDRATELDRVLFTHDDDLLVEAHLRQEQGIAFAGVIYVHQHNITIGQCIDDLELIAKYTEADEYRDRVQYLPL